MIILKKITGKIKIFLEVFKSFIQTFKNLVSKKAFLYTVLVIIIGFGLYNEYKVNQIRVLREEKAIHLDEVHIDKKELFKSVKRKPLKGINFDDF